MQIKQEYGEVRVKELQPHPNNPNRGDVAYIQESIAANGWYGAIIVQKSTMRILAGEHRWKAAKKEGALRVPVILVDVDDRAALRIMLVDNEAAKKSHYDDEVLAEVLASLVEMGDDELIGTGFSPTDLEALQEGADADDDDDESGDDDGMFDPEDSGLDTQYGVVVMVASETEQERVFNEMKEAGYQVRCVAV